MRKHHDGFTLIELMIAALLMATVAAGVLGMLINAKQAIRPGSSIAGYLVKDKLESLYEAVRQDWWGVAGNPLSTGGPYTDTVTVNGVTYNRSYNVTAVDANADGTTDDYRKVDVTITWPD